MDAGPLLAQIGRELQRAKLEAVLIGNAGAALQGAPVTTVDFDFFFHKTPANLRKLKSLARGLGAAILRPYYPASDLYRITRDDDGLQLDFMGTIHGIRSSREFEPAPPSSSSRTCPSGWRRLPISFAARKPRGGLATSPCWRFWRKRLSSSRKAKKTKLAAVARENERNVLDLIRRWQALPASRRTNFLRRRLGPGKSAL